MAGNEKGAGLSQRLYKRKGPTAEAVGPTTHPYCTTVSEKINCGGEYYESFLPAGSLLACPAGRVQAARSAPHTAA